MDQEDDFEQQEAASKGERRVHKQRTWTMRTQGELRFRRYSSRDAAGRKRIYFSILLPEGEKDVPSEVWEVFKAHQKNENGHPTGLSFSNDRVHGKVWSITDHEYGRALSDRIDMILLGLGARLDDAKKPRR